MSGLRPRALLETWERSAGTSAPQRALTLLDAALGEELPSAPEGLSAGARDAALLGVRRGLFGERMRGTTTCDGCGETLELELSVDDLVARGSELAEPRPTYAVEAAGHQVTFRLPGARDLAHVAGLQDVDRARAELLARSVIEVRRGRRVVDVEDLPTAVVAAVDDAMGTADPYGHLDLVTTCPGCSNDQTIAFDAASFVCTEVEWEALRLLDEVHDLASAYGWSEDDVLALSPVRRRRYLELVRQ